MDMQEAVDNFANAMTHCDNLIKVHKAAGDGGRGRRTTETSVNRGTIVLAVAAWQAFVQDAAMALRDEALVESRATPPNSRLLHAAMRQWEIDFNAVLEKFSTPGPDQTVSLLKRVGFNPMPSWTWTQRGGRGKQDVLVEPKHVAEVIKQWLRVRHDVAHGHSTIHSLPILGAVRDPSSSAAAKAAPTLRLDDAEDCVKFFRSVVRLTAEAGAGHVGAPAPTWEKTPTLALGLHISNLTP
ncbi:hypothetical protein ACFWP2_38510 [Kitasatospora sp. NPDC058444]|uniref:hypothetical protein n=1 Tax=Kitasatospora sp. NPDC058444 TaxID=3346504 RepID=UPI003646A8F0